MDSMSFTISEGVQKVLSTFEVYSSDINIRSETVKVCTVTH